MALAIHRPTLVIIPIVKEAMWFLIHKDKKRSQTKKGGPVRSYPPFSITLLVQ
jgi:hypothetical protein